MGMIALMLRVNKEKLEAYLEDSSQLEERLYSEEEEFTDGSEILDIDKSWDAILYLLCGEDRYMNPLAKVIFSGKFINEEQDFGYGPAHYLLPEEVSALSEQISKITMEELAAKYDADAMNEAGVYPSWSDDEEEISYLLDIFAEIQAFYAKAAAGGQGIVSYMS